FTTYPGYSYIRSAYAEGFDRHIDNAWADLVLAPLRATRLREALVAGDQGRSRWPAKGR
ncbi:MAG: hypothetical protein H0X45_03820, partial [Planctomycetes bacterium]|nr:hypothetical protein [Planctomycetota bacterium]